MQRYQVLCFRCSEIVGIIKSISLAWVQLRRRLSFASATPGVPQHSLRDGEVQRVFIHSTGAREGAHKFSTACIPAYEYRGSRWSTGAAGGPRGRGGKAAGLRYTHLPPAARLFIVRHVLKAFCAGVRTCRILHVTLMHYPKATVQLREKAIACQYSRYRS